MTSTLHALMWIMPLHLHVNQKPYKDDVMAIGLKGPYSTANIKALRRSLGALSVNKLRHIPKLQPISAVYENQ